MIHSYKLNGLNIVLDTLSGSIHVVDEVAFDVINMYEHSTTDDIVMRITTDFGIDKSEVVEIIADIEELKNTGKLFSKGERPQKASAESTPLKALCLNISHVCNMRCEYCFAGQGEYGDNGQSLMPLETGKRAIDFLIENSKGRRNLDVDFFGGEPLLNWDVVKQIVLYAREIEAEHGKNFRFTLTTNGLLIDDDVIKFTSEHMYNVVLSLDGKPETNDLMRKLADSNGSYDTIVPKLKKLVEARGGRDYYIRGTFTRHNIEFVDDILHIADLGFRELSMEPVVAASEADYAFAEADLEKLSEQYERLAMEMLAREEEGRGFSFYHYTLNLEGGPCLHKRVAGCGVGTEYLAVTPSGELFPCHQFVGNDEFIMGDVWSGVDNDKLQEMFNERDIYTIDECADCWAKMYCSGGCAANSFNAAGSIDGIYKLGCELFKKRMECAIMMQVARVMVKD